MNIPEKIANAEKIVLHATTPISNYFGKRSLYGGIDYGDVEWVYCRDSFYRTFYGRQFYFGVEQNRIAQTIAFINECEKKLGLSSRQKLKINLTDRDAISITLSPWWAISHRKSLLTALLRAGRNYTGDFSEALYSVSYTKTSRAAVSRFFNGFTYRPKHDYFSGWCNHYNMRSAEQVKKLLIKRERNCQLKTNQNTLSKKTAKVSLKPKTKPIKSTKSNKVISGKVQRASVSAVRVRARKRTTT